MAVVTEIAADVFRISVYVPEIDLQFNHFLVRDEQPLLFHAGYRRMFGEIRATVASVLDPARIRHISFSHFESDECGALNDWLGQAPAAEPVVGLVGSLINLQDFAIRPPRSLTREDVLETGKYRFRFIATPQLPHGWDAGVLFEENQRTLFCSDLFHQWGNVEPLTEVSILDRARAALMQIEAGPLAGYVPYTRHTGRILEDLASLAPQTLATMHGSTYRGDGAAALRELAGIMQAVLSPARDGSLYHRLGGYDAIASIIDDVLALMKADPMFARFSGGRSQDSRSRGRQMFVDQMCALAGGPCLYIGRDMKAAHSGLAISEAEWDGSIRLTRDALRKHGAGPREEQEFVGLLERYREEIIGG